MILPLQSRRYRYYCSQASKMHFLSPGWSCLQTAVASSSSGVYCETLLPTWMGSQWAGTQCHPVATTQGDPPLAWTADYATSHCCLMCGSRRCHDDCDYSVPSSRQQYTHGSRRLRLVGRVSKVGRSRSIPQQSALQAPTDMGAREQWALQQALHNTVLYQSICMDGWMNVHGLMSSIVVGVPAVVAVGEYRR